jgi:hypothetical protein
MRPWALIAAAAAVTDVCRDLLASEGAAIVTDFVGRVDWTIAVAGVRVERISRNAGHALSGLGADLAYFWTGTTVIIGGNALASAEDGSVGTGGQRGGAAAMRQQASSYGSCKSLDDPAS